MVEQLLNEALRHQKAKELKDAKTLYLKALKEEPCNLTALLNLGLILKQEGHLNEAVANLRKIIAIKPDYAEVYNILGNTLLQMGALDESIEAYQTAISIKPDFVLPYDGLGIAFHHNGDLKRAKEMFLEAVRLNPAFANAYLNLGNLFRSNEEWEEAAESYRKAIQARPDFDLAINNLAGTLFIMGQMNEAADYCRKLVSLCPNDEKIRKNLGNILLQQGEFDEAIACFEEAIRIKPGYSEPYDNMGSVYYRKGEFEKSLQYHQKAIALNPDSARTYVNLGKTVDCLGNIEEAISLYKKALTIEPSYGLRIRIATAFPHFYDSKEEISYWREKIESNVDDLLQQRPLNISDPLKEVGTTNFFLPYQGFNDRQIQEKISSLFEGMPTLDVVSKSSSPSRLRKKIKIGFISRLMSRGHTIGKLMLGVIEHLSREKFDVVVFTVGSSEKPSIASSFTHIDLPLNNLAIALKRVASEDLDILYYADIGMDPVTFYMAFSRLAKVQCVTWGHPVTTGINTIDYFISSSLFETENAQFHYREKLVLLDNLNIYYYRPSLTEVKGRDYFGLGSDEHIYLCPQSLFKFHPDHDAIFGNILRGDPKGKLVLVEPSPSHRHCCHERLLKRFAKTIPDLLERIIFVKRLSNDEFVNLQAIADVMLDTIHFGGGNTSLEAFAFGTPIVTMPLSYLRGRVTSGCYKKMEIYDCIATTPEEYASIAIRIGTDSAYRHNLRSQILKASSSLFEDMASLHELESFFIQAVETVDNR